MFKAINGWTKERMKSQVGLKNNGTRSMKQELCAYRGANNNACAIGCFIPDERYNRVMDTENMDAYSLFRAFPELGQFMPLGSDGMMSLQRAHDDCNVTDLRGVLCDWIDKNVED